jgi:uncharacterized phage infection (PIP) family protein YhgE
MRNSAILNLGSTPESSAPDPTPRPEAFTQTQEALDQTKSEIRRMRSQLQRHEDEYEVHSRKTKILSMMLAVLLFALAASIWFAYPTLRDQKNMAATMLGLHTSANTLSDHVQSLQSGLNKTSGQLPVLTTRMDQISASMKAGLQTARTQAQTAANQMGQRIRADFNQTVQAIQSRMAGLESNQQETAGHVNQLEEQIASLKKELATVRQQSSDELGKVAQIQEEQQIHANVLSRIDQKVTSHQTSLDSISSQVEQKRSEFNVMNRKTEEVAPGIFLTIRRADAGKQEVDGTLQLSSESRMLTIRAQGLQKPFLFYGAAATRPMQLVFTGVTKSGASGYLVMPGAETTTPSTSKTQ